ncbi:MAG: hypothetical protein HUJ27_11140 [Rhodobacteraceae bacterium]|nr:hypothetical protein [Paracoccaceae bacterium]
MNDKTDKKTSGKAPETREDRLKAALKANLARRKKQARARRAPDEDQKDS